MLLQAAGEHRTLIATAIMAGGLRVSELTHLHWRDLDLRQGILSVAASKTAAGVRQVVLDPELVQLLREHKLAAEDRPPLPNGITFHALRRTYAVLRAELGEHPAITAAQMGHRDPRMTLRVYTRRDRNEATHSIGRPTQRDCVAGERH